MTRSEVLEPAADATIAVGTAHPFLEGRPVHVVMRALVSTCATRPGFAIAEATLATVPAREESHTL